MSTIAERTRALLGEIARLEARHGRAPGSVTLLGISKTHDAARVREAHAAGLSQFGESYVQEALPKIEALADLPLTWHFVGRIQGNKTAAIAGGFAWVHGIDRLRIARRLNEQRPPHLPPLDCCIEVNLSGEASKGGADPQELPALATAIAALPRLRLRGLMTLPAPSQGLAAQRLPFARLRALPGRPAARRRGAGHAVHGDERRHGGGHSGRGDAGAHRYRAVRTARDMSPENQRMTGRRG